VCQLANKSSLRATSVLKPPQIIEESEEFLKAVSAQNQEAGRFPLKQVCCLASGYLPAAGQEVVSGWLHRCVRSCHAAACIKQLLSCPRLPPLQRDDAINAGFAWFREKGLIPSNDSSDDDVNYAEAAGVEW
jgi:hypothetical protein